MIDRGIELRGAAERGDSELARSTAQRGLELRPRALFVLELGHELAVLVFPLVLGRYLRHRRIHAQGTAVYRPQT